MTAVLELRRKLPTAFSKPSGAIGWQGFGVDFQFRHLQVDFGD